MSGCCKIVLRKVCVCSCKDWRKLFGGRGGSQQQICFSFWQPQNCFKFAFCFPAADIFLSLQKLKVFLCVCCCKVDFAVANLPLINFCSGRSKGVTAKCLFAAADQGFAVTGLILAAATLKLWTGPPVTTVYSTEPGPSQEGT